MLAKARQVLVGELALAEGVDDKKSDEVIGWLETAVIRHREAAAAKRAAEAAGEDPKHTVDLDDELDED
jgi:CarD family transcriptional regulator